jgi:hypothetical protein
VRPRGPGNEDDIAVEGRAISYPESGYEIESRAEADSFPVARVVYKRGTVEESGAEVRRTQLNLSLVQRGF